MRQCLRGFPQRCSYRLTGTPLITEQHGTKRTVKRFGEYIDTYKLMDAVHDGASGDILEAEKRIEAISKDLVDHFIDKKLREHNLLQAIARVNRVATNEHLVDLGIAPEILLADIPALGEKHERLAVEIVKLAEKRHEELIK